MHCAHNWRWPSDAPCISGADPVCSAPVLAGVFSTVLLSIRMNHVEVYVLARSAGAGPSAVQRNRRFLFIILKETNNAIGFLLALVTMETMRRIVEYGRRVERNQEAVTVDGRTDYVARSDSVRKRMVD